MRLSQGGDGSDGFTHWKQIALSFTIIAYYPHNTPTPTIGLFLVGSGPDAVHELIIKNSD